MLEVMKFFPPKYHEWSANGKKFTQQIGSYKAQIQIRVNKYNVIATARIDGLDCAAEPIIFLIQEFARFGNPYLIEDTLKAWYNKSVAEVNKAFNDYITKTYLIETSIV